jgi:hypothetical protein
MLDLRRLDLRSLAEALEDHSSETSWWFDPQSGEVEPRLDPLQIGEGEQEDPRDRDLVLIEPIPSREAYGDMEDFIGPCAGSKGMTPAWNVGRLSGWQVMD